MDSFFVIFLLLLVHSHASIKCPYFCSCDLWEGMRRISCVNQRLASTEVNAPLQVQVFDLSKNSISELRDKGFYHHQHIKYLNISHNKIVDIHSNAFYGLTELNVLDLSHNHLKSLIPNAFERTTSLQELYLSGNEIGHFGRPPVFQIPSLQVLHLRECWLDAMDERTFSRLPNLAVLDISYNQFVHLRLEYLRPLSQLNSLDLLGNPWHCNDEIQEVITELQETNVDVTPVCEIELSKEFAFNGSMFEKIISVMDSSESEDESEDIETLDEDIYNIWYPHESGFGPGEELQDSNTGPDEELQESDTLGSILDFMDEMPSFWALILGIQIGIVVGVLGMWVWLRCNCSQVPAQPPARTRSLSFSQSLRRSVGRHRTESCYTELESVDCPGTPPPPYRDVALNTFR